MFMKTKFFNILLLVGYLDASPQRANTDSTDFFADNFKKLVALNSSTPDLINLSYKEAVIITSRATAKQIVDITAFYINSTVTNAKSVCLSFLSEALFKKAGNQTQKQEIVEIICKNYLSRKIW